ncbi:MAG: ATP-dependent DNA helicase RecG [Gammaproteobacteria bacterium]|nr:ATP-dependent DNA helicase RecG [Gammaproteobacteria bacterium]
MIDPFALQRTPVTELRGVGKATSRQLARLEIEHCLDLPLHLPFRWQRRTSYTPLADLRGNQECLVLGRVIDSQVHQGVSHDVRRSWDVRIADDSGTLTIRFFHFSDFQLRQLRTGDWMRCFGVVRIGPWGRHMIHPEYRSSNADVPPPPDEFDAPVYHLTAGLTNNKLTVLVKQVLPQLDGSSWPAIQCDNAPQLNTIDALRKLHQPEKGTTDAELFAARNRLALEELAAHLIKAKDERKRLFHAPSIPLPRGPGLGQRMVEALGFSLTRAQSNALKVILPELEAPHAMLRLLQGDVGSGKTVVAAFAALRAAENGHQAVIMAPTEMLAEQHFSTLVSWFAPLDIGVRLLTGSVTGKPRQAVLEDLRNGTAKVILGTHALFQSDVEFDSLALVIIDEQHRFGVYQRLALKSKGREPHQLIMTATPIPRTLAMTMYAHMDHTVLDELPPGRTPVTTTLLPEARRRELVRRVGATCQRERQAYWVCTRIEESEEDDLQDVHNTAQFLREQLPDVSVEAIHGRMSADEKHDLMRRFRAGEIRVLVATTVIEVGVDVPGASLMIIENPERLGLAQLHQLRGRVGRGHMDSHCVLLHGEDISSTARERLNALVQTNDGFELAEKDLALRGEGEITGVRQSGLAPYRVADLRRDRDLLSPALAVAERMLDDNPEAAKLLERIWVREVSNVTSV